MTNPNTPLLPAPEPMLLLPAPGTSSTPSIWQRHPRLLSAGVLAAVLLIAFAIGWFVHHRHAEAAKEANEEERDATPIVTVVAVKRSPTLSELLLPGSLTPITEASLYARASGYVRKRYVDIGDSVKKGQVLAEIDSPELDAQLAQGEAMAAQAMQQENQAVAAVGDAQAKVDLARVTTERYETLLAQDSIARQDVDVQRQMLQSALAALTSAKANVAAARQAVRAARANVQRLAALQRYESLRAPFDGVITARNVDEGSLIGSAGSAGGGSSSESSGSGSTGSGSGAGSDSSSSGMSSGTGTASGSNTALFRIAQVDRLRVYVYVPQDNAAAVQVGSDAGVFIQQFAQRFVGRVARTAQSIDASSRTLLAEVQIPNRDNTLMPGMYAQVRFASERSDPPLLVPGETVISRAAGTSVAILVPLDDDERSRIADADDRRCARRIHMQPVVVGRDYGTEVEIARGLQRDAVLVLNPSDSVRENTVMLPELQKPPSDGEAAGGGKGGGQSGGKGAGKGKQNGGGDGGSKQGAASGKSGPDGGSEAGKDDDPEARAKAQRERRRTVQQTCVEDQVRRARSSTASADASASAVTVGEALENGGGGRGRSSDGGGGGASAGGSQASGVGGPSDRSPAGIQSPSMRAPTQGANKGGAGKKP